MSQKLATRVGEWIASRPSRRDFLVRTTLTASAMAVAPLRFLLRPESAYAVVTSPTRGCPPGALCYADGYVEFCCTINEGVNECPAGTIAGGWWKADGSIYCRGPRYYIDCVGECSRCTAGCKSGFCPDCDDVAPCDCANGDCGNRRVGCRTFRYGQCHQEIGCVGRLACRVVSCTPAWQMDPSCTTSSATDNRTANQTSPCLANASIERALVVGIAAAPDGRGYWIAHANGAVYSYGSAVFKGGANSRPLNGPIVAIVADRPAASYWLVGNDGGLFGFGAPFAGSTGDRQLNRHIVGMAPTKSGNGYWMVAADGGVFAFGDAAYFGSTADRKLNWPIVAMAATPSGLGYTLVALDGGVFCFGDARFFGSLAASVLGGLIVALVPTPSGNGYWMAADDGGVFCFGDAGFFGSAANLDLRRPIVDMAASPDGRGYWLVASDGGVFAYGAAGFFGSPTTPVPITSVPATPSV